MAKNPIIKLVLDGFAFLKAMFHVNGNVGTTTVITQKAEKNQKSENVELENRESEKFVLTLNDLLTSSGKYPKRVEHPECTQEIVDNGVKLLEKVNALLADLGIKDCKISSGFRPSTINSKIPNAAKKSLHMLGMACDIEDPNGTLDKAIQEKPELLKKHTLWLEHPDDTPGWCHLDISTTRKDRPVRIFKP